MSQLAKSLGVAETPVVLLRVCELVRSADQPAPTVPVEAQETAATPAEPETTAAPTTDAIAAAVQQDVPSGPAEAIPARRRDAKPPRRDWYYPSLWQGTVGLLLLALLILACFMLAGSGKKHDTAGPAGKQVDGQTSPEELKEPDISIPDPTFTFAGSGESKAMPRKSAAAEFEPVAAESAEQSLPRAFNRDGEPAGDRISRSTGSRLEAFGERPPLREEAKPRTPSAAYPVTPAGAIYPVTDPGKFRYPDDASQSDTSAR